MQWLADDDRLAAPWTVEAAADMMWALMSPDLLDRLLTGRGWPSERITGHLATLFAATFVQPAG